MNLKVEEQRKKETANFWRALGFLGPHWKIVTASILCAFMVGALFTSGLTTILPIVQVLIKGDSVQAWVDRQIVAGRLGARLADDPQHVAISSVKEGGAAQAAGLQRGEIESVAGMSVVPVDDPRPQVQEQRRAAAILRVL